MVGQGCLYLTFMGEYQSKWDEAFAEMENRANEFADKIEKAFEPV